VRRALGLVTVALLGGGCGDDEAPELRVSAAASLKDALTRCSRDFQPARVRLQFAGSDTLAAQIRQGSAVDVFAAANTRLPEELARDGELERPVRFATNRLVLAVPAAGGEIDGLDAVARPGVRLVIGSEGVPVGDYTRTVLANAGRERSAAILANVRSEEPDVVSIVGKLLQGAADAGFVYATDVEAAGGELRAIELPAALEPTATYGAGVVAGSERADAARRYVDGLVRGPCHDALRAAGFGAP
jgi:molybdate transport system substrate-binding protein